MFAPYTTILQQMDNTWRIILELLVLFVANHPISQVIPGKIVIWILLTMVFKYIDVSINHVNHRSVGTYTSS